MSKRFDSKMMRVPPKPSATERTWRRFRERHEISTPEDVQHFSRLQKIKDELHERMAQMLGGLKQHVN